MFGWQVGVIYDNTTVVPQGDPSAAALYPDGAANTAQFGAQTGSGNPNWAGMIVAGHAFGSFSLIDPKIDSQHREILVFFTIIAPNPAVNIGPTASATVKGNLLANIAFELIKPATSLAFSIDPTNTEFVDNSDPPVIIGLGTGPSVSVTITNNPPVASFTPTVLPLADISCTPVTGLPCSGFAVKLDGSASADSDGSIANPAGYFWDFGDGTQDSVNNPGCGLLICNQGPVAIHDYGAAGKYNATLRVVDNLGATGSARDGLGSNIVNKQPSHTMQVLFVGVPPDPTATSVLCSPSPDSVGSPASCSSTVTDTASSGPLPPTGTVAFASNGNGNFASASCTLSAINATSSSCTVTYTPTAFGTGTHTITVSYSGDSQHDPSSGTFDLAITIPHATTTTVNCGTPVVVNHGSTCNAVVNDTATGYTFPTGTVTFTASGSATGTFSFDSCDLFMVTNRTSSCQGGVTFTASATGTALIAASYAGDATHAPSSSTAFTITVGRRSTSSTVSCTSPTKTGSASACTVTVADTSPGVPLTPTGTISLTTSSTGTFNGSCTLTGTGDTATCSVNYTPTVVGTHTVTADYSGDAAHDSSSGTFGITVTLNQPPTLTIAAPSIAAPGQAFTLSFAVSDPDGTVANVTVNWGDGTSPQVIPGSPSGATHTYASAGTYNVTVTVKDNGGRTTEKFSVVTVANPSGLSLEIIALIAIIALIVIAGVALMVLRRKRISQPQEPRPPRSAAK